ncbi:hypothetical protein K9M74_04240 [Candidatus Woesearchaeota archaeon]|nr:hypothetical protein [Candidatus Woesearchaeota archaeon]
MVASKSLIIMIILFSSFLLLTSCSSISSTILKEDTSVCDSKASQLVPDEVTLFYSGNNWYFKDSKWSDGSSVKFADLKYYQGSKDGQNVNYFYPVAYNSVRESMNGVPDNYVSYSKRIVSDDGVILGSNYFNAYLVLKPLDSTKRSGDSSGVELYVQVFEVVDFKISDCSWIEDVDAVYNKSINHNSKFEEYQDCYSICVENNPEMNNPSSEHLSALLKKVCEAECK